MSYSENVRNANRTKQVAEQSIIVNVSKNIYEKMYEVVKQYPYKSTFKSPTIDEEIIKEMQNTFPNNPLAMATAFDYIHSNCGDGIINNFMDEYNHHSKCIRDKKNTMSKYNMDCEEIRNYDEYSQLLTDGIKTYEDMIATDKHLIQMGIESPMKRLLHPFSNTTRKIKKAIKENEEFIAKDKMLLQAPLSPSYENARDNLVEWETKYDVHTADDLTKKLDEYESYVGQNMSLNKYATSLLTNVRNEPVNVKYLCKTAEQSAWDGKGYYGENGNSLVAVDINNPAKSISIYATTCEPSHESFSTESYIRYDGKIITAEQAQEIMNNFRNPFICTHQEYQTIVEQI